MCQEKLRRFIIHDVTPQLERKTRLDQFDDGLTAISVYAKSRPSL